MKFFLFSSLTSPGIYDMSFILEIINQDIINLIIPQNPTVKC
jgi:hypothetical protein